MPGKRNSAWTERLYSFSQWWVRKVSTPFANALEYIATHWLFGGLTAIITIATGGVASFYSTEIKDGTWPLDKLSIYAVIFWVGALLVGSFLGLGQWAQGRKTKRTTDELQKMVVRLQTLPADGFLPSYTMYYRIAAEKAFVVMLSKDRTRINVEHAIRLVLSNIIYTAWDYDNCGETDNIEYCANIMLWRPKGEKTEAKRPVEIAKIVPGDERVAGVLEVIPALSTSSESPVENALQDENTPPLILPIPRDTGPIYDSRSRERSQILPGAPLAFCRKEIVQYRDITEIIDWLESKSALDLTTRNDTTNYFRNGPGQHIRSVVSLPIMPLSWDARNSESTRPIAILNIHSSKENLLAENGNELFAPLIEPFLVLLSILIAFRHQEMVREANPPPKLRLKLIGTSPYGKM